MQDAFSLILSGWNPKCVFLMDRWILLLSFWISLLPQSWSRCFCKHFAIWKCRWKPPAIFCRNISDENHWHRFLRWKELGWNRNTSAPSSNYMAMLLLMVFFLLCHYFFRYDGIFNQPLAKQSNGKLSYRQISIGVFLLLMFRYSTVMVQWNQTLGKECVQNSDLIGQVFEKKCLHLHQGCLVTDYLVLTPNMNTLCNRGKVGLICFVAPQKSIFLWRPPPGFNFQMSKGVNLSPLVNPENEHKLKKKREC